MKRSEALFAVIGAFAKAGRQLGKNRLARKAMQQRFQRLPHLGEKEQDRALRCYMEPNFPNGNPRSAPVMLQVSKKHYRALVEAVEARRLDEASWV